MVLSQHTPIVGANISLLAGLRNTRRHFGGVCGVFPEMLNQDGTSLSAGDTSRIKRTLLSASWLWCKVATARDTHVTCRRLPHHKGPGKDTPHPFGLTLLLWRVLSQWWESTFIMLLIRSRFAGPEGKYHEATVSRVSTLGEENSRVWETRDFKQQQGAGRERNLTWRCLRVIELYGWKGTMETW